MYNSSILFFYALSLAVSRKNCTFAAKFKAMTISSDQNTMRNGDSVVAVFMPYQSENRCAKCCFSDKKCKEALCTPDERKDRQQGFWRSANARTFEITVIDAFKPILH